MNDRPAAAAPAREGQAASNNYQPPSLTSEAAVQRYLEEMRMGKSNAAILQALSEASFPPPSPVVVGDFGEEGAELGSEEEARRIWQDRGWLPAVHGPYEEDRRRLMAQHRLHSVEKLEGVDRIADLAQSIFEVPIVVVSLVLEDREKFTSTIGWDKDERDPNFPRISIPLASALCPHRMVVLEDDTEPCLILPDAKEDWRFRNNPYVRDGGPVAFFASTNIYLTALPTVNHVNPEEPQPPRRLPVGSLCIVDRVKRDTSEMTPERQLMLKSLASMIGREFELASKKNRLEATRRQAEYVGSILRSQMVNTSRAEGAKSDSPDFHNQVAAQAAALLNADSAAIVDLRAFHAPHPLATTPAPSLPTPAVSPPADGSRPSLRRQQSELSSGEWYSSSIGKAGRVAGEMGIASILGCSGWDWSQQLGGAAAKIAHFFITYYSDDNTEFDSSTVRSPLADLLPPSTQASLAVPIFDVSGEPALLLVVCSNARYFRFEPSDRTFVENVGAVLIASLLRKRIIDADRAKLQFVSSVSHELRTPLHGIGSQIELIRAVCSPDSLKAIEPLLAVADVCVASLREILDDTLSYSKMSNSINDDTTRPPILKEVDLEELCEEVIQGCWSRGRQRADSGEEARGEVEIILNVKLDHGARAMVDVGGLKRVLFNLIGNSLKFTNEGIIEVSLRDIDGGVSLNVADTGRGMSEAFLKEQLFMPFRQADSFGSGAGLGVSIADSIVKRMSGTLQYSSELGVGTTASIALPLQRIPSTSPRRSHRSLSTELSELFSPLTLATSEPEPAIDRNCGAATPRPVPNAQAKDLGSLSSSECAQFRVLGADDNPIGRRILSTFFKTKNVDYEEACDGAEAFERYKAAHSAGRPFFLFATDVQMPVCDGIECSRLIRAYEAQHDIDPIKIVAISGLSSDLGTHASVLESGQVDMWLIKGGPTLKTLTSHLDGWKEECLARLSSNGGPNGVH